ncbi:MAG: Trk system potassium transporter TrkA [Pseudomonadota bacterium]
MLAIVCGAGNVGRSLVQYLVDHDFDVAVIDSSAHLIADLLENFDVRAIVGHAASPSDLERAGANEANILFAFTRSDEINMMACQIAHSLFKTPVKIARVRSSAYTSSLMNILFNDANIPVDHGIAPEEQVAQEIIRCLLNPGVFSLQPIIDDQLVVAGIVCKKESPMINTNLRQLSTQTGGLLFRVLAIIREHIIHYPTSMDEIKAGDNLYIVAASHQLSAIVKLFGHQENEDAKRIVIVGAGHVSKILLEDLKEIEFSAKITVIEKDEKRARDFAEFFPQAVILSGHALSPKIMREANVEQCDAIINATRHDEVNLFAGLLAKKAGTKRAISIINEATFVPLLADVGIDVPVYPRQIVISALVSYLRRGGIRNAYSLRDGFAEVFDVEILENSSMLGKSLQNAKFPDGVVAGLIVRNNDIMVAKNHTNLERGDRLVLIVDKKAIKKVEAMFSAKSDFF